MAGGRRLPVRLAGAMLSLALAVGTGTTVHAGGNVNYLDYLNGGMAAILNTSESAQELISATEKELSEAPEPQEPSTLVMANVKNALNVREQASEDL